eukprot:scaffold492_cov341-Pavlova_lutheri.AAC.6
MQKIQTRRNHFGYMQVGPCRSPCHAHGCVSPRLVYWYERMNPILCAWRLVFVLVLPSHELGHRRRESHRGWKSQRRGGFVRGVGQGCRAGLFGALVQLQVRHFDEFAGVHARTEQHVEEGERNQRQRQG